MQLSWLDISIIVAFLVLSLVVGLIFTKRASTSMESFFLGGRSFPWWLSGLSMVATTFAADTPLAVTELVAQSGIAGNWLWWNMMAGGMLTTLFFAHLWWRSGILTDVELVELRYSGGPARFLRGMKSIYLGLFMNVLIIGWVNKAMEAILVAFFDLTHEQAFLALAGCVILVMVYSGLSGLWGVAVTDAFQFVLAMTGCIVLAYVVIDQPAIGGMAGLAAKSSPGALSFFPSLNSASGVGETLTLGIGSFLAYIGVQWWSSWYPGAEPGGGGYVAQRIMSAKSQRDATLSSLLFQIMHFCVRPWPWVIVALASLILYPGLAEPKLGYVYSMRDYLPNGLRGMLLASFLAAYMSTISSQFNWGAGYLVNDFYLRFVEPNATDSRRIWMSRVATGLLAVFGLFATLFMDSIAGVWQFMLEAGAGIGLVLILRWYWWRINAWSEIVATIIPLLLFYLISQASFLPPDLQEFPGRFFLIVGLTTVSWLAATYLTRPESDDVLRKFFRQVDPEFGWDKFRPTGRTWDKAMLVNRLVAWVSVIAMGYSILFATGSLIFGRMQDFLIFGAVVPVALVSFIFFARKGGVWNTGKTTS